MKINRTRASRNRRGAAAMLAMLFLVLMTTLCVAMLGTTSSNLQSASSLSDVARAHDAAESGLRWMQFRFLKMQRPKTKVGNITASVATTIWPALRQGIIDDFSKSTINGQTNWNQLLDVNERPWTVNGPSMTSSLIATEDSSARFQLEITPHPLGAGDPLDARYLRVSSTGTYRSAIRTVALDFKVDKKVKFAVVGKVPIQLGRNTIVEGPVAMANPNKFPPLLMLSDFMHFDTTLKNQLTAWNTWLQQNHNGFDNRVSVNNTHEYALATSAGYSDVNGDAYIDEYDFFLNRFDSNHDKAISQAEFTNPSTGKLYEGELFKAIDSINGPMYAGDSVRLGYQDNKIDNNDGYAKLRGYIQVASTSNAWLSWLDGQHSGGGYTTYNDINDFVQGTVAPTESGRAPVEFGVNPSDMLDLDPANFEDCADNFKTQAGNSGTISTMIAQNTLVQGKIIAAGAANGGTVLEESPKGSKNFQAVYKRPVFKNITFKDCKFPKGLNAVFDNCKFQGVTFVEDERNILDAGGATTTNATEGMNWARRKASGSGSINTSGDFKDTNNDGKWDQYKISGMANYANITQWDANGQAILPSGAGSFSYGSGTLTTKGSTQGNNIRFNGCTFEGPLAGSYATAYTHFANSWEFTGSTLFNNQVDQTATIVSPQVNIEMGSFTNPNNAPSTMIGVVVAGNIDIRGTSNVDGSIIITGDGAGNTTLAYFGANDASTDPNAPMPEGGWGRLNIRYNPHRALPDGINIAVDVLPDLDTYLEGSSAQ